MLRIPMMICFPPEVDLVKPEMEPQYDDADIDEVVLLLKDTVASTEWDVEGASTIERNGQGGLVVTAPVETQWEITRLLDRLREMRNDQSD